MSIMILHDKTNNNWNSQGFGPLVDAMNPEVLRERNGAYELTFSYPVKAPLFKELLLGRWIVADAGASSQAKAQRFEIAEITKPINGIVEVYCEHYSYQLLRSAVKVGARYEKVTAQGALNELGKLMVPSGDFTFFSDVGTLSTIDFTDPSKFKNAQEVLGGVQGSILDNFQGEYIFNNNQVRLMAKAGIERNVIIAYGKNLTDISQEESIENTYTSVYGYAKAEEEGGPVMVLPEVYLDSEYVDNYTQRRVLMVDFSQDKPENVEALRTLVKNYIKNNKVGIPKVNIKAKYVDLASSVMGEQLKVLEILDLCDWVTLLFNDLEINTMAQIIKTTWNVALDKFDSLELGEATTNMSKVIRDEQPDLGDLVEQVDWLEKAQQEASDIIKNPGKGHVVIYPSLADPQEILIMDTMDINTAQNVWRWNAGGLGFSSTGYNGTYGLAMTNNGAIVADRITAGVLRAINIVGVTITGSSITSETGANKIILNNGVLSNYVSNILRATLSAGALSFKDTNSVESVSVSSGGLRLNRENSTAMLGAVGRLKDSVTGREEMVLTAEVGGQVGLATPAASGGVFIRRLVASSQGIHIGELYMGGGSVGGNGQINFPTLNSSTLRTKLLAPNNVALDFYSALNMHGFPIYNQSDIRLKDNISPISFKGIKETKRLQMAEFDYKQNYDNRNRAEQRPQKRQFGIIAQSTPLLSEIDEEGKSHYLNIDLTKQVNLNTLTNKELIEIVEGLENRVKALEENRGGVDLGQ
ncbi:phage tail spike protein [Lactococcus petauri]|uniref:phage tail spike protein n=1 Tax=Lactococcus petauri TaxID=1940789 RepID=UPI0018A99F3B|nr:phage tail spike protein [Lactococcus petauri]MDC0825439.1 phage tail protein [Lactococcus petauri]